MLPVKSSEQRILWVDVAKGIAILLVVFGHVERGLVSARWEGHSSLLAAVDFTIYTFHMPLFFFLSGYLSIAPTRKTKQKFASDLMKSIVYPYFLWSTIEVATQIYFGSLTNRTWPLARFVEILWDPVSPYWFLYALFVIKIFYFAINNTRVFFAFSLALFAICFFYSGEDIIYEIMYFCLFFSLGSLVRQVSGANSFTSLPNASWLMFFVLAVLWAAGTAIAFFFLHIGYMAPMILPVSLLGIAMVVAFARVVEPLRYSFLPFLGKRSMAIFVTHVFFTAGTRIFLVVALKIYSLPVHLIVGLIVGVAGPILLYKLASSLRATSLLGFEASAGKPKTA
jgi:fucose 4-O-acetylase-like acetyltransferase